MRALASITAQLRAPCCGLCCSGLLSPQAGRKTRRLATYDGSELSGAPVRNFRAPTVGRASDDQGLPAEAIINLQTLFLR